MEYKRYCEWYIFGRRVKRFEKATHYFVDPVSGASEAVFSHEQTEPLPDLAGYELVPAADKQPTRPKKKPGKPRVFVEYDGTTVFIHVGNKPDLIELLKARKFRWMPKRGRWWRVATRDEVDVAKRVFEKRGYEVVYTEADDSF